mmetsp:Transcript_37998/g.68729  ORF Transcript_37998/g.68729 Transcript_37998/m.68729 type:complete len:593 (-) Transcript_37998:42-1820(-)
MSGRERSRSRGRMEPYSGAPPAGYGAPPAGYGAPPPGYSAPPPAGYGAPPPAGYGAPPPASYGVPPPAGYGAPPPAGYSASPPPGYGHYPPAGYGGPPPAGYGAPPPAGYHAPPPAEYGHPPASYGAPPPASYGAQPQAGYGGPPPAGYGGPPPAGYGAPPPAGYGPPPAGYGPPPPAGYSAPPPPGYGYGAPPPPPHGYGAPPPPHGYGAPPPPGYGYGGPPPPGPGYSAPPPPGYGYGAAPPPGFGYGAPPPSSYGHGVQPQYQSSRSPSRSRHARSRSYRSPSQRGKGRSKGGKGGKHKTQKPKVAPPEAKPPVLKEDGSVPTARELSDIKEAQAKAQREAHPEATRDLMPLQLLKDRTANPGMYMASVDDAHLRSWMYLTHERSVTHPDFQELKSKVEWRELKGTHAVTRKTMWYTKNGCTCPYHYGTDRVESQPFPPWFELMVRRWLGAFNLNDADKDSKFPDSVNMNLYEHGEHSVSWHSDDEPLFRGKFQDTRIISVSLGAARKFQVGLRAPRRGGILKPEKDSTTTFTLGHGHICTMEGLFQKHYLHQIAKGTAKDPRINATFRYIVEHEASCPMHVPGGKGRR